MESSGMGIDEKPLARQRLATNAVGGGSNNPHRQ